jgi:hypothetical protein
MAVTVVRRRELTFWEKLYVPQILGGLKITFAHFFRNLLLHTAHLLGHLKNLPRMVKESDLYEIQGRRQQRTTWP